MTIKQDCIPKARYRVKGKGKVEYLYSAIYTTHSLKVSNMNHTVLTANYTMPAFPS